MGCNRLLRKGKSSFKESKDYIKAYNPKYKIKNYVQEAPVGSVVEIDGYEYYYCPTCKGPLKVILHNNQEYVYCTNKCFENDYDKPVD